jgi:histone-lysine N-methyltransferase SETMAR
MWKYLSSYVKMYIRKRPELQSSDCILHHDNASAHKALSVKQFLAQKSITEIEHPLYSPDLALSDFWLLPKIKPALKGQRFQDTEDIQTNVTVTLKAIPQ